MNSHTAIPVKRLSFLVFLRDSEKKQTENSASNPLQSFYYPQCQFWKTVLHFSLKARIDFSFYLQNTTGRKKFFCKVQENLENSSFRKWSHKGTGNLKYLWDRSILIFAAFNIAIHFTNVHVVPTFLNFMFLANVFINKNKKCSLNKLMNRSFHATLRLI